MSTAAGAPANGTNPDVKSPERNNKGKGKSADTRPDAPVDDDDDDEDDEDEENEDEDDEEMDEDDDAEEYEEIDPSAVVGRRTRGVKVDYTSKEALQKAGLNPEVEDEDDEEMK